MNMNWFDGDSSIKEVALFDAVQKTEEKKILLPLYQRDAVWSEGRMCALWDSLLRGFPLQSFLLVEGKGDSRSFGQEKRESTESSKIGYFDLLDGQQRLTAIIRGVSTAEKETVRLWLDLAPPTPEEKIHPFKFKYWIHPCTNVFPFGFRMEESGEHDFAPLHDGELNNIWTALQRGDYAGKDFYEIPLDKSFPWHAGCPVPLDELIALVRHEHAVVDCTALANEVEGIAKKHREKIEQYHLDWKAPQENVIKSVVAALLRLKKTKLVFQLIDLESLANDEDGYTLFERIGRGGVQITQKQLAVSKLMLILGAGGNDAVAGFHKTRWGRMLETEDIIHALARIAYVVAEVKPLPVDGLPDYEKKRQDWDMLELSTEKLKTMKNDDESWRNFKQTLVALCEESCLKSLFDSVFEKILLYHPTTNPHGFSLVQLGQGSRSGEGIAPITLHPLLLWQCKYGNGHSLDKPTREDMLRWVLFANGMVKDSRHGRLNRSIFLEVFSNRCFNFLSLKKNVLNDEQLRRELGFSYSWPKLKQDGKIESTEVIPLDLLEPKELIALTTRRLLLLNSPTNGVSNFILMWNQRAALHDLYGDIKNEYLPALHGKGRPFDLDHIIARNRFLYSASVGIDGNSLLEGTRSFFGQNILNKSELKAESFRKSLPNNNANYRYWPKHLNRADKDNVVSSKMDLQGVRYKLANHPLSIKFKLAHQETVWDWSAIPIQDQQDWEMLPPDNGDWNAKLIDLFIRTLLRRQYHLYGTAYQFLTPGYELSNDFCPNGIICTD